MKKIQDIFTDNGLYIQDENYTCGASSVINALRVCCPEKELSIEESIALCGTTPKSGSTNKGLIQGLQSLGCVVEEYIDATIDALAQARASGLCVILNYYNPIHEVGHYAVLDSVDEKAVYLRDSAIGFVRIKREKFEKIWYDMDGVATRWFITIQSEI